MTAAAQPRLVVVSGLYGHEFSPRGIRARALVKGLGDEWQIEVVGGERSAEDLGASSRSALRGALTTASRSVLVDGHELWSRRRLGRWRPEADLGLLLGYPFSPVAQAARRLARSDIPYVVDVGDPWTLTHTRAQIRHLALMRARRAERRVWQAAAGAIVTTAGQAHALTDLFPALEVLVRPNGYHVAEPDGDATGEPARRTPGQPLQLVHFGRMYYPRVTIAPFLRRLASSGLWPSIVLHQYGDDDEGILRRLPEEIAVEIHAPVPWPEAIAIARRCDLALAVGNQDPRLLPSKVIDYLTLPIPRVAIVGSGREDAIRDYVRDKPGWLVLHDEEEASERRVAEHLARDWSAESLAPPPSEAWAAVTREVGDFLRRRLAQDRPVLESRRAGMQDAPEAPHRRHDG